MTEVAIVASAFGAETIRRDGHAAWIDAARRAGAAAFEVRRELMADADVNNDALAALGARIAGAGLWPVWSTPDTLYRDDGALDEAALRAALDHGRALGARFAKLQLGAFAGDAHAAQLAAVLAQTGGDGRLRVVVENGQLAQGGTLAQFVALFRALDNSPDAHARRAIGMTFDIGNWQWPGEPPLLAAAALAPYVEYVHCKAVTGTGARRFATAPAADDPLCRAAFAWLPPRAPRGIEFPFDPLRVADDAARYVGWLAAA
ncbi:TIM barrel protein [Paraburkholderia caballeronis]|uniref:TIM barrel protein n=1 Tax=Paraburkholderia caballeronis TaxID=416943 RepID=UPI001064FF35|nr:TIM barrel protein [Paraburkholderia caballeronis]TDV20996.1 sugar phosphate isomerase/epimerase [Paraburkholderia caballeronis]TDV21425.1 sugar phosphate isomerase/epimerase [Paraburkholderia caballeronis]TDV33464.1 sugar phosphate isomerase/epimerase [Paraburkholderia caballeronis]TDV37910.1 sugar phosphate isomerase/epimerase [Paraburkholderia caballeronis]